MALLRAFRSKEPIHECFVCGIFITLLTKSLWPCLRAHRGKEPITSVFVFGVKGNLILCLVPERFGTRSPSRVNRVWDFGTPEPEQIRFQYISCIYIVQYF